MEIKAVTLGFEACGNENPDVGIGKMQGLKPVMLGLELSKTMKHGGI